MASDSPIQLYADLISSPARAVYWFFVLNNIPHELKVVKLSQKENLTKEGYDKIHPFKKVPSIEDNGFPVFESQTILRYVAEKFKTPDHWYPQDLKERTKIQSYLDWHHINIRGPVADLFAQCFFLKFQKQQPDAALVEKRTKDYEQALTGLENYWLLNRKFIGGNQPSIADLSAFSEIYQLKTIHFDYSKFPVVQRWMQDMAQLGHFAEVHTRVNQLIDMYPKL